MEIYLLVTLVLVYVLTVFMIKKHSRQRLWLIAFMIAFVITGVALSFLRFTNQDIMMNAAELSWYYILYLFASIMIAFVVICGIIGLILPVFGWDLGFVLGPVYCAYCWIFKKENKVLKFMLNV